MENVLKFSLEVELCIDGKVPSKKWLTEVTMRALYKAFPSLIIDDEDTDCLIFVNSCNYRDKN